MRGSAHQKQRRRLALDWSILLRLPAVIRQVLTLGDHTLDSALLLVALARPAKRSRCNANAKRGT